jgi:hypothetical protein
VGGTNIDLHASFNLNNGGEAIGLFASDGLTPLSRVTFGSQIENVSRGCFPDGNSNATYFMTNFTPRAPNTLAAPAPARILSITRFMDTTTLNWSSIPGRTYRVDYKPGLEAATWTPLGSLLRATSTTAEASDTPSPEAQRFYRIVLLQ